MKILAIDLSGNGTTGICLRYGIDYLFFQFSSKIWKEHYNYLWNLINQEKPRIVLLETVFYESSGKSKSILDLTKLVGALECLTFHYPTQLILFPAKVTKDWGRSLKKSTKKIPNLTYQKKKWLYQKTQPLSQHQVDALILQYYYDQRQPYLKELPELPRNICYRHP